MYFAGVPHHHPVLMSGQLLQMVVDVMMDLDLVVTAAAIASSVVMQLAVVPTAVGWLQGQSVKEHPLQFVAMALDAVVGLGFSLSMGLFASIAVRISGTVILGAALAVLILHAQGAIKDSLMNWLGVAGTVAFVVGLAAMIAGESRTQLLGTVSVGLSIASTSSPLAAVATVLQERDASSMVPAISLASFASCAIWTYWAAGIAGDPYTTVSSSVGMVVAALQLVLIAVFHPSCRSAHVKDVSSTIETVGDAVEKPKAL